MTLQNNNSAPRVLLKKFTLASFLAAMLALSSQAAFALWTAHSQTYLSFPADNKEIFVDDKDKVAIRTVISGQIQAFRSGDRERAFSYASPGIKQQFETPAQFFATVKSAYDIVLVPRSVVFEDVKQIMGVVTQPVLFLASDGDAVIGSYIMAIGKLAAAI